MWSSPYTLALPQLPFQQVQVTAEALNHAAKHLLNWPEEFAPICGAVNLAALDPRVSGTATPANRDGIASGLVGEINRHAADCRWVVYQEFDRDGRRIGTKMCLTCGRLYFVFRQPSGRDWSFVTVYPKPTAGSVRRAMIEKFIPPTAGRPGLLPRTTDTVRYSDGYFTDLRVHTPAAFGLCQTVIDGELRWAYDPRRIGG